MPNGVYCFYANLLPVGLKVGFGAGQGVFVIERKIEF
jgi:hypothetical protein